MSSPQLRCHYFEAGRCRSCTLIETTYDAQLREKAARCRLLLSDVPPGAWLAPYSAGDRGFRNRAKLVVGGVAGGPVSLGILGPDGSGIDLRECQIQSPGIAHAIPILASFIEHSKLSPYSVPERRGELKFVHVTEAPSGALMLRFVVRSEHGLSVLRSLLTQLRGLVPRAEVITVNLLPEHKAVLEGEREVVLHGDSLAMQLGTAQEPLTLHLRPQSFFQTNTAVARELYDQVASWVTQVSPGSLWDLYCGVGGFALHCAAALRSGSDGACDIIGIELSEAAVGSAQRSAQEAGLGARFIAADATDFALSTASGDHPEMLIVNPPRRGIGEQLARWLEASEITHLVYSSCNPESLARDLQALPSYRVAEARVFDMFPHTRHLEVAVRLERLTQN